ncbi:alpha-1,6-mannosylglycoprotein 6-beta-N-acetylglucosaminyltransferase A-like [Notolabrus celidotus]|uniref:alpha-1,6-mannosylglycoprotein 6-beta-N-acetylglucosaminyltransferase A-like n=1 Tax=Notolabrus celidotus TaxID=1203425 RepID=UPI00148FF302|nr:alpha-1,6-mannosylglycoprotein 6-beta-N-acetylglucosaminyltransferase A-like [Notolabrus celidotus]
MRKLTPTLRRTLYVFLGICFIWCLSFPYVILRNSSQKGSSLKNHQRLGQDGRALVETKGGKVSPPPLKDYKEELTALQIKMEAEKVKGQTREEMIIELRSDKLQLQQQLAKLEELLKLQAQREEKKVQQLKSDDQIKEDKNCPFPPMDGFPECKNKLKWMQTMWKTDSCYYSYGVNGSLCSILIYLSEIESWCPLLPGRLKPATPVEHPEMESDIAVVRESLTGLYPALENRTQYRWINQRIHSMEDIWVEAGRSLSAKYDLTQRRAKQILVHPGALTDESNVKLTETAFKGGPLGELVQWSDLISSLYILGHHLHLTATLNDLRDFLGIKRNCPTRHSKVEVNLIYTDIIGFQQIQKEVNTWTNFKCLIRVLDSFGTEPDFNHAAWAKKQNLKSPFGGLSLIPKQFYTMFPHTPDNTFLGFVVQHQLSNKETEQLKSIPRQSQALVYGKSATFWKGKEAYLDVIHKYLEIHGTVDNGTLIPSYVKNHGIIKGTEVQSLLRQSKVFVGLSFPYEGPAPLEALANGCAFLNPRLHPPQSSLNSQFFKGKPNIREVASQHPYAEAIGEPYVWLVDMNNSTDVERALNAILNQSIEPYLPFEFTCEGMLQRVNILIEKQDFCDSTRSWPPLSTLQVVKAEAGTSCKQACKDKGLICEPAFFPHLNSDRNLLNYNIDCQSSELSDSSLVFPAYGNNNSSKHCLFQSDSLLFSCVRSEQSLIRICPCRDYIKDQIALCKECI